MKTGDSGVGIGLGAGVFGGRGRVFDDGSTCGYRGCCDDRRRTGVRGWAGLRVQSCEGCSKEQKQRKDGDSICHSWLLGNFGSVSAESLDHRVHGVHGGTQGLNRSSLDAGTMARNNGSDPMENDYCRMGLAVRLHATSSGRRPVEDQG